jgi:hypothetical protein
VEVNFAFFCDAATIDASGKVNVLGIFNRITALAFPCVIPKITFVFELLAHRAEVGKHTLKIVFMDEDGKSFLPSAEGAVEIKSAPANIHQIFEFKKVKFEKPGIHEADIVINGNHTKAVKLNLVKK